MSAAAGGSGFPSWVLLEPYVFRRDDDESFPDDTEAPVRASATTSWGADIRIAFSLAEPPRISRLYAQLPDFLPPHLEDPLYMLANHRHLAMLDIATEVTPEGLLQDLFIFRVNKDKPSSSSLIPLPPCTEPLFYEDPCPCPPVRRLLDERCSGLWCGGGDKEEEFVVAELNLDPDLPDDSCSDTDTPDDHTCRDPRAYICFLRSSFTDDNQLAGCCKWDTIMAPILSATEDDTWKLSYWHNDAVIPFQQWLCWVDYSQGILFWDVFQKLPAAVSFFQFLPGKKSLAHCNCGMSVVNHGRVLKFVKVAPHGDLPAYRAIKPGTGFTITCHTLVLGDGSSMAWKEDYTVTSDELPDHIQRGGTLLFPQVDIVRPQVAHFLFCRFGLGEGYGDLSVISIDLSTKTVESSYVYVDRNELLQPRLSTVDVRFIRTKTRMSCLPRPAIPFEFPGFCTSAITRKSKDMG